MTTRFRRVYVSKLAILRDLRSDLVGSESRRREEEEKRSRVRYEGEGDAVVEVKQAERRAENSTAEERYGEKITS